MGFLNDKGWGSEGWGMGTTNDFSVGAGAAMQAGDLASGVVPKEGMFAGTGAALGNFAAGAGIDMVGNALGMTGKGGKAITGAVSGGLVGGVPGAIVGGLGGLLGGGGGEDAAKATQARDQMMSQLAGGSSARERSARGYLV